MFSHAANINNWVVGHDSKLRPINTRQSLCKTIHNYDSHPGGDDTLKCSVIRLCSHHRLTSTILVYQSTFLALGFYSCASRNRESDALQAVLFLCQNVYIFFSFSFFSNKFMRWNWRTAMYASSTQASSRYNLSARSKSTEVLGSSVFSSLELNHLFGSRYCE